MTVQVADDDIETQVIQFLLNTFEVAQIVGKRVFVAYIPEDVINEPCVVVTLISSTSGRVLSGHDGRAQSTVQIDSYSLDAIVVKRLNRACKLRMISAGRTVEDAHIQSATKVSEFTFAEQPNDKSDNWRFRRSLRFEITHCETVNTGA